MPFLNFLEFSTFCIEIFRFAFSAFSAENPMSLFAYRGNENSMWINNRTNSLILGFFQGQMAYRKWPLFQGFFIYFFCLAFLNIFKVSWCLQNFQKSLNVPRNFKKLTKMSLNLLFKNPQHFQRPKFGFQVWQYPSLVLRMYFEFFKYFWGQIDYNFVDWRSVVKCERTHWSKQIMSYDNVSIFFNCSVITFN